MLREDVITSCSSNNQLRLGHYSLPEKDTPIFTETIKLNKDLSAYTINNGEYTLLMIPLEGWDDVEYVFTENLCPISHRCATINAVTKASENKKLKTLMLFSKKKMRKHEIMKIVKSKLN